MTLPQEIIRAKRDGRKLTRDEIGSFIAGLTSGAVTEGQAAAFAMAVFFRGMSLDERVALSTLVSARTDEFVSDHPEREVTRDIAGGLAIRGREDLIDRLITNSFSNIIRHTSKESAVRVRLHLDGPNVQLVIEDGGGGLPEYGVRPQRFRRFDQSRSRETGGSGIGMSIMADIVEGLGGSMTTSKSSMGGLALNFTFAVEG